MIKRNLFHKVWEKHSGYLRKMFMLVKIHSKMYDSNGMPSGIVLNNSAKKQSTPWVNMAKSWWSLNTNDGQSIYLISSHLRTACLKLMFSAVCQFYLIREVSIKLAEVPSEYTISPLLKWQCLWIKVHLSHQRAMV